MGREKDRWIEEEERGWYSTSQGLVCNQCVDDPYLSKFITENGEPGECAFCETDAEAAETLCVPFDALMDVIGDGINWAYSSADDEGQPYETAEGGYIFSESVFDTYDLVVEEIGLDVADAVRQAVIDALPAQMWCRSGFWSLSRDEALRFGWQSFVEKVKYQTRFLFTLPERKHAAAPTPKPSSNTMAPPVRDADDLGGPVVRLRMPDDSDEFAPDEQMDDGESIPAYRMLDSIGEVVERFDLTRTAQKGELLYRVRVADKGLAFSTVSELGPPSRENARQPNRMSPAGIVMFYGALDRATALAETFQPDRSGASNKNVWIARFKVLRDLTLLDLTKLPAVPSMFDADNRHDRADILFLRSFVRDLVQPIERDGREHIEYVPTQIVTEYFRHRFRTESGRSLDGILYRSSKRRKGIACVLFVDSEQCGAPTDRWSPPEQVLALVEDQIEVLDGAAEISKE
ncbi:MAG: RES domain-containing protein [Acidobacteria bacterium]|nr:RES domain-containing protein [Acidobacteriota bacterium]